MLLCKIKKKSCLYRYIDKGKPVFNILKAVTFSCATAACLAYRVYSNFPLSTKDCIYFSAHNRSRTGQKRTGGGLTAVRTNILTKEIGN
jgi:hypothetical protein